MKHYPFNTKLFKVTSSGKSSKRKHLENPELVKVLNAKSTDIANKKELALSIFKFIFYTGGINFTDLARLKMSDVNDKMVSYTRKKTKKQLSYFVHDIAFGILTLFETDKQNEDNYVFPFLDPKVHIDEKQIRTRIKRCLKEVNRNLKEWGQELNLGVKLTTYTARHSFASECARKKISPVLLQQTFGHSSLSTTMQYIGQFATEEVCSEINEVLKF